MGLIASEGVLGLVSKVAAVDEGAALTMVEMALFDALGDQIDACQPYLAADLERTFSKNQDAIKRALVQTYIDKRLAGEEVEELIEVAKNVTQDDPTTPWWDARDAMGRFTSAADKATEAAQAHARENKDAGGLDNARYRNLRATGAALAATGNPHATAVGAMATAVGNLGPEAEKVLRPGLTRVAYRYRGTEKRPDKGVKNAIAEGLETLDGYSKDPARTQQMLDARAGLDSRGRPEAGLNRPVNEKIAAYYARKSSMSPDAKEMGVIGDVAAFHFASKLPNPQLTAISIAAGRVPPSQGMIIDADGDVVSEAVGFNGDHYLPFDLKNLRSLNGGQYVRTRATGGLTSEDIYTGLMTGARQVQVVSQSGVFTLEFDPDLRGGRRYSDKARQMVGRYEQLLKAIDDSANAEDPKNALFQTDLSAAEKAKIYRDVASDERNKGMTEQQIKTIADREINSQRVAGSFKMKSDEELHEEARATVAAQNGGKVTGAQAKDVQDEYYKLRDNARKEAVKRFQLDGEGYNAAMLALQQEFPYFIRDTRFESLPEFANKRDINPGRARPSSATDRGYVTPGGVLARSVAGHAANPLSRRGRTVEADKPKDDEAKAVEAAGVQRSPDGTPKAQTVPLADAYKHPKVADGAAVAMHTVMNAALDTETKAIPAGLDTYAPQEALGRLNVGLSMAYLGDVAAKNGLDPDSAKDILKFVMENPDGTYAKILHKIVQTLPQTIKTKGVVFDESEKQAIDQGVAELNDVLSLRDPFGQGDPLTYDPKANAGKPLSYPEIVALNTSPAAFAGFEQAARVDDPELAKIITAYSSTTFRDPATDLAGNVADLAAVKRGERADNTGIDDEAELSERVQVRQKAYAFVRAQQLAQTYYRLTKQTWDADAVPFAPAPQAREGAQDFQKRDLRLHPPGSALATEFRKFLQTRTR